MRGGEAVEMVEMGGGMVGGEVFGGILALTLAFFASTKTMSWFTKSFTKVINDWK